MSKSGEQILLEPERYEFLALPMHRFALERRDFFKLLGAGIAIIAVAKDLPAQETAPGPKAFHNEELPKEIGAWLHIAEDGTVTGFVGKAEMGQNVRTSLAQTIADELGVTFGNVRMLLGDTALTPFDMGTFGSRTTPTITPLLRRMAAAARQLLLEEASKKWNVPADRLTAGVGKITDPASGRSLRYAELAREDLVARHTAPETPIKPASQWTIAGKPVPKADGRAFVTGSHLYSSDLRPEGMLFG
jgi:isoquinoline 1-oxidoreductase